MEKFAQFVSSIGETDLRSGNEMGASIVEDNVFLEQLTSEHRKGKAMALSNHELDLEAIGKK